MASNSAIPPPIPDVPIELKFDGGVQIGWIPVKQRIINSLKTQGLVGYTDGTIIKPSSNTPAIVVSTPGTTSGVPAATPVFSTSPSLAKWTFQNDRAKGIADSHIKDLLSLIPKADKKDAQELMKILESTFGKTDGMQQVLTERHLCAFVCHETEPINSFFKQLWEL